MDTLCFICKNPKSDAYKLIQCSVCKNYYHYRCCLIEPLNSKDSKSWYCQNCLEATLPFNHIIDADVFNNCITESVDTPIGLHNAKEGPKLAFFNDHQVNRPLINNSDLDPDHNYYVNRPIDHGYNTPSQLTLKLGTDLQLCSFMHVNTRSISPKLTDIQLLLHQIPVG